ncbi:MAG: NADH-quinone oxidoreductase subunit J [Planctomycetes bacterium]|nr:NADH-quinone oxidoreductase subunit J [Planctomycetota bacterium]
MAEILFYVLSALALLTGFGVVLAKSPMMSILSLLGSFFCLAVIYLLAGFQFLAAAQILVYAGAILVLFLFVIMLLNLGDMGVVAERSNSFLDSTAARLGAALAVGLGVIGLVAASKAAFQPAQAEPGKALDGLEAIALQLFGRYSLAFEAASILLLATMVAVIALAKRQRKSGQNPTQNGGRA